MSDIGLIVATFGIAYLLGSLSSAILVCRFMGLPDPRESGSNNPGATNVLRIGGKKAAIATLAGDVMKGFIPVYLITAVLHQPPLTMAALLGAFLGHLFPLFFGFKGGKGVATAIGGLFGFAWQLAGILVLIWVGVAFVFRYSSLAALVATVCAPILAYGYFYPILPLYFYGISLMSIILLWRHRQNIRNLLQGKETKIGQKK